MRGNKIKVGVDVDDVLMPCMQLIIDEVNRRNNLNPPLSIEEYTHWGVNNDRVALAYPFFKDPWFFQNQTPYPGAQEFIRKLSKKAEVFIISSPPLEFMSDRAMQIMKYFPEIKKENIILGSRKDIMDIDVLLDDNVQNILTSRAKFPVLMRDKPWNRELSGCLSINSYDDFFKIIDSIQQSYIKEENRDPYDIICIVGPSGSNKNAVAKVLEDTYNYPRIYSYTTGTSPTHKRISEEEFKIRTESGDLFETSYYAGERYSLSRYDIEQKLRVTSPVVVVTDIAGAMTLKNNFNCLSVFTRQSERQMYENIITKNISKESMIERLLSFEAEKHNENLCDVSVEAGNIERAAQEISNLIEDRKEKDISDSFEGIMI